MIAQTGEKTTDAPHGDEISDGPGEVKQSPGDNPIFVGLQRGKINLVVTDTIPTYWDGGRALAGVSTIHDGYHISMISLRYAQRNQIAFLSVNTCLHEILHVLLQDIFLQAPKAVSVGRAGGARGLLCDAPAAAPRWRRGAEIGGGHLRRLRAGIARPA
jgi:hypothetical protein